MVRVLAIGNSFAQDAMAYLHRMAAAGGTHVETVNLFIGGCSLQRHWHNLQAGIAEYDLQVNGASTGRIVGLPQTLADGPWDFVTLQQASPDSGDLPTYYPYISDLYAYAQERAPGASFYIHQTWAYELDSPHAAFTRYGRDQAEMYRRLKAAYEAAARDLGLPLLPCGDVIQALRDEPFFDCAHGGRSLCRDGHHLDIPYGRFAAAATWYACMLRGDILRSTYVPAAEGAPPDPDALDLIRRTVRRVVYESGGMQRA